MKRLFLAFTLVVVAAVTMAQTFSANYLFTTKGSYAVTSQKVGQFTDIFGRKGLNADAMLFGGVSQVNQAATFAGALGFNRKVANEATIYFGPAVIAQAGRKLTGALYFGGSLRF